MAKWESRRSSNVCNCGSCEWFRILLATTRKFPLTIHSQIELRATASTIVGYVTSYLILQGDKSLNASIHLNPVVSIDFLNFVPFSSDKCRFLGSFRQPTARELSLLKWLQSTPLLFRKDSLRLGLWGIKEEVKFHADISVKRTNLHKAFQSPRPSRPRND
jgi:hypothetical protein